MTRTVGFARFLGLSGDRANPVTPRPSPPPCYHSRMSKKEPQWFNNISLTISVFAFLTSVAALIWTQHIDSTIHRPYIGMVGGNAQEIISTSTLGIVIGVPLENFGDLPAKYEVQISFPPFNVAYPLQSQSGYLMPGQEEIFRWYVPMNSNARKGISPEDFCRNIPNQKITVRYGLDSANTYYLEVSASTTPFEFSTYELGIIDPSLASSTVVFNCTGEPKQQAIRWSVTNSW